MILEVWLLIATAFSADPPPPTPVAPGPPPLAIVEKRKELWDQELAESRKLAEALLTADRLTPADEAATQAMDNEALLRQLGQELDRLKLTVSQIQAALPELKKFSEELNALMEKPPGKIESRVDSAEEASKWKDESDQLWRKVRRKMGDTREDLQRRGLL